MRTLNVSAKVGNSLLGTVALGPRFPAVEMGRMVPLVRTPDDLRGLLPATFLDPATPLEVNLLAAREVRKVLIGVGSRLDDGSLMTERQLLRQRPIITYIPPETLTDPNPRAAEALGITGPMGLAVADLRSQFSDVQFWRELARRDVYRPWVYELASLSGTIRGSLLAPPVPVISRDQPDSAQAQLETNSAFARIWNLDPTLRAMGALYSLHLHPSAFREKELIQRTLTTLDMALSTQDVPYWGIHLNPIDLSVITSGGGQQVEIASDFLNEVTRIVAGAGLFVWMSDFGPVGPSMLDRGAAFSSYSPGMTFRRIYVDGFRRSSQDTLFGKVIGGLWDYNLHSRSAVSNLKWQLRENGNRFPTAVPVSVRDSSTLYRQTFAKPYNVSIAETQNEFRERELVVNRQPDPGRAVLGRSRDGSILPWAI
jgi:hypothetical protein